MADIFNNIDRKEGETDEELIYRICSIKDNIGTWQEVADILNSLLHREYNESAYRKKFQAFQKMMKANRNQIIKDMDTNELDKKLFEMRKERIKLQTANMERNRIDRSISRQEMYYEYVGKMCETLPIPTFKEFFPTEENNEMEYCLTIADVHYGAKFKSENNRYSTEIVKDRFELLANETITFLQEHQVRKLHVVSLGDLIQGILRINDLKLNETTVVKATVEISRLIALFLNSISEFTEVEYYHTPAANHTQNRPLGTKANELADEDLEYLIGNYIKDLCRNNKRIHVNLAEEGKQYIQIDIVGNEILAMHGHQIKNIETSIKDFTMLRQSFIDYLLLGHFHSGKEVVSHEGCFGDCEILISPSFVGSDPYSDSLLKGGKSAVKIYGFSYLYGHTETYKIILN